MSLTILSLSASPCPTRRGREAGGDQPFRVDRSPFGFGSKSPAIWWHDELVVRHVPVERVDHPIAVAIGLENSKSFAAVRGRLGVVVIGITDDVEPVAPPALTVSGRGQQAVHDLGKRVGRPVVQERFHFLGRRRQAGQVECGPADQRPAVGRRGGGSPFASSLARMKRSMSDFGQAASLTGGVGTDRTERPVPTLLG